MNDGENSEPRRRRKADGHVVTASEVAGMLAVVTAGFLFLRWLLEKAAVTAAGKQGLEFSRESLAAACEAEAFGIASLLCIFAFFNTVFPKYEKVGEWFARRGSAWRGVSVTTRLGVVCFSAWALFFGLYVNPVALLIPSLATLLIMLWGSGNLNKPALFSTSYLSGVLLILCLVVVFA